MKNSAENTLSSYVDALYPIIYINHFDFHVIDTMLKDISNGRKIFEFNHWSGFVDFDTKTVGSTPCSLEEFLDEVKEEGYTAPNFIVLKDVHDQLDNPNVISLLKFIASRNLYVDDYNSTVFIVASKLKIPRELEDFVTVFDIPLPTNEEISRLIDDFAKKLEIKVDPDAKSELCLSLKGLNEFQIQQILNLAFQDGGSLDLDDKQLVSSQKEQLIKKSGLLEMVPVSESIEDIGGLDNLKSWLYRKERIFNQLDKAMKFGVDVPKGILIVGMPGCGKSLAAKATAKLFQIPLVRLDVGRLLGKYVGESEENMRNALKLSEAISPCVLWVDEIEKAFSGVGSSNGGNDVTTRLFGQFLTWMQEKENTVFIVATANNISSLPPEFLRKGRFDELFYVDFPNYEERRKIIEIHLKKRGKFNHRIDINSIANETEGYNGADLEAMVKDAIETCFIEGRDDLTTNDLKTAKESIKSISVTLEKQIKKIKEAVKDMDLKSASDTGEKPQEADGTYSAPESAKSLEPTDLSLLAILGHDWWKRELPSVLDEDEIESSEDINNHLRNSNFKFEVLYADRHSDGLLHVHGIVTEGIMYVRDCCSYAGSSKIATIKQINSGLEKAGVGKEVEILLDGDFTSREIMNVRLLGWSPSKKRRAGSSTIPDTIVGNTVKLFEDLFS